MNRILASKWTKVVLFLLCLIPVAKTGWLLYRVFRHPDQFLGAISANPVEYVTHSTGDWTIRFLLITLAVTPLRMIFKRPQFTRFRRMLGLFAFFYGFLHLMTWVWLDKFLSIYDVTTGERLSSFLLHWLSDMVADVYKRPFITVGMLGFLIMVPLAITSTAGWVRRLGFKRWTNLHRIVYIAPAAGVVHFWWLVKSDITMPLFYGVLLAIAMAFRVYQWTRTSKPVQKRAPVVREAIAKE